ncbi:MAG: transferase, partial [Streptomyces sp.]|nr:transferase [Streptomyces sp.]
MTAESSVAPPAGQQRAPEGAFSVPAPGGPAVGRRAFAGRTVRRPRWTPALLWLVDGGAVLPAALVVPAPHRHPLVLAL